VSAGSEVSRNFKGPKSRCTCGHTGDGAHSEHAATVADGHGRCLVPGCACAKFSWYAYLPQFEAALRGAK